MRILTCVTIVCISLLFAGKLFAAPAPPTDLLRQAYVTLAHADHDYKGHRAKAMKQIEAAAKELGFDVRGDGKGHEPQGVSDNQLHAAQGMLEQARAGLSGKPLKHVNRALKDLSIALKIK